ncbi:MAG: SDR family oxidoreductase [Mesorhizobium sp.]|nr:MAG: SDR family oxidoreductase [Mesorhizobium sp.]
MPAVMAPSDVGRTAGTVPAVFLCSDAARGITMENIQITGDALW